MSTPTTFADVVILGGGPAGAVCGLALKQDPHGTDRRVLVVERDPFPRYKVCGCCFNGAGQGVLESIQCEGLIQDLGGVPLEQWEASFAGRRVRATLPTGWALSREALDEALLKRAAEAGVEVIQPATGKLIEASEHYHVQVNHRDGRTEHVDTPLVVVASGLASSGLDIWLPWLQSPAGPIGAGASFLSQSTDYQPGTIYMACSKYGYAGMVRLEDGRLDVAAALYDPRGKSRSVPLGRRVAEIIAESGMSAIPELELDDQIPTNHRPGVAWKGTPMLRRQRTVGNGGLLAIGDAAGYVEPFTGEGMAWAMQTARMAADSILRVSWGKKPASARSESTVGADYSQAYRRTLTKRRLPCRMITRGLRHDFSRSLLFSALATAPWLARPFIGTINHAAT